MNTEQSYVGRGNYANPATQSGQNAPKSPSTPDNRQFEENLFPAERWQFDFLQRAIDDSHIKEWLFQTVDIVEEFNQTTDPTPFICELLQFWLANAPDIDKSRNNMSNLLRHIALLNNLRSTFACLEDIAHYSDQPSQQAR